MDKKRAEVLRGFIVKRFIESGFDGEFTSMMIKKCGIKAMDDWVLTADEIMAMPSDGPETFFMTQIAKLASLFGCDDEESKKLAVESFGKMVQQGEV